MAKQKLIFLTTISVLFSGILAAGAWGSVLRPGDHVIDFKRLADSIRETVQQSIVAQNALSELNNLILMRVGDDHNLEKKVQTAIDETVGKITGTSLINPANSYNNSPVLPSFYATNLSGNSGPIEKKVLAGISSSNRDLASNAATILSRSEARQDNINEILGSQTDGILGEHEKGNDLSVLDALQEADQARLTGAAMVNRIEQDEADTTHYLLENERAKMNLVYDYDPYHPSEYDQRNNPGTSENYGFIKAK